MTNVIIPLVLVTLSSLLIYYLLPRKAQNYWLLFTSYGFCAIWSLHQAVVLLAVSLLNFVLGKQIARIPARQGYWWLGIGIVLNILPLATYKYHLFEVTQLFPTIQTDSLGWLGPIGFSFIALHTISYLIDVHQRRIGAESNLIDFGLYLAYFPKLVAGPIVRPSPFLSLLKQPRIVNNQRFEHSLILIMLGLVRKLVFADLLAQTLDPTAFSQPSSHSGPELAVALLTYTFIIYNDFAGYICLVRGLSGLYGIDLPANFKQPYLSRNISDFWSRWHISFSDWLRDYIYFPVSRLLTQYWRDRSHLVHIILPPLLTMLVSGVWHGISFHMLLWGVLHALYIMSRRLMPKPALQQSVGEQLLRTFATFTLVSLAWVPFRAPSVTKTLIFWERLPIWEGPLTLSAVPLVIFVLSFLVDIIEYHGDQEKAILRWPRLVRASALAISFLVLLAVLAWPEQQTQSFIYQGF